MHRQRSEYLQAAAGAENPFRFLSAWPLNLFSGAPQISTRRGLIHSYSQGLFQGLAHFLQTQARIAAVNPPQKPLRIRCQFSVVPLAPSIDETIHPLFGQPALIAEILSSAEGNRMLFDVFVDRQARGGDFFHE